MTTVHRILLTISLVFLAVFFVFAESFQGINYTVIEKSNFGTTKSSIVIMLEKKVSKEFLQKLALNLRESEPIKYDRIFIVYYLPGMIPGTIAWATSHFNPDLEVEILGTTIEEEKALLSNSKNNQGEIIGEWFDEVPYLWGKYTFLKRNGKIIMIIKFQDGSSSEKEMVQKNQSGKLRFEEKEVNDFGEYYLIEKNGNMGVYDNAGLICTMRLIK